jgi:hypothetical protein
MSSLALPLKVARPALDLLGPERDRWIDPGRAPNRNPRRSYADRHQDRNGREICRGVVGLQAEEQH